MAKQKTIFQSSFVAQKEVTKLIQSQDPRVSEKDTQDTLTINSYNKSK